MAAAFFTNVAVNLVSKLGEYLLAPIGRQFGYVLCYKCYVKDLEDGLNELQTARERVQRSVDAATYNGNPIHTDVQKWLTSVEEQAEKAKELLKDGKSAKNACCREWIPNPMVRHPIGRKVKKMTPVIRGLHEGSAKINVQTVYYENPPMGLVTATAFTARPVDKKEDELEYWAKITEDVMKALVNDKIRVIGVYGPGGVGKSKLLDDIKRRVEEEKLFRWVARANVTCNPDLKRIQGEVADAISMKPMNEETPLGRAPRLCERLKKLGNDPKESILIILDDLWDKLELKDVGIPCGDDNKITGCKLLLTSRKLDVLRTHMGSDQDFQLNLLEHGDARRLFERIVGDRVNNPEFEPLLDRVVENCRGLPFSIVSLAKILKQGDLAAWTNASINRDLSNAKSLMELSYNHIKGERIRSLFLICALTSGRISTRDSIVYSMGWGLFKEFNETIQNARCQLIVDLQSLQDSSLLLDNDGKELFEMHDLFVEVAISIASTEWNALVGRKGYGFKEWSDDEFRKCTVITFSYVGIDELPPKLDCPNLKMLLILEQNRSLEIPDLFFASMGKLQVLDVTGLDITTLPRSTEFLVNLKSLSLDQCYLEDVTVLGKLKGLQFLSFKGSEIARLPKEIGELTELKFLDLTGCYGLEIIEPGVLGSLVNLEELYVDSFDEWEAEYEAPRSNASLAELKNMNKLRVLNITIPHSTNLPSHLPLENLNEHKIRIGGTERWWGEYKESRTLKLKLDSGNLLQEVWMQVCLERTQDLRLGGLQDGRESILDLCPEGFKELKHLHVKNNLSFQYVVDSTHCPAFTELESLVLKNLNNLERVCRDCLAPKSFGKLKIVKAENCGEIKYLFPSSMTRTFLQLEEIEITRCHSMQQIVADAEVDEYRDEIDDAAYVKSCNLRSLTLQDLPEMTSFYKTRDHSTAFLDGQQVSLPRLESLKLSKLPKLKEIWNSQFPSDVTNLKFLEVEDCAFLLSIFRSNMVIKLHNLEAITIERCQLIREVFDLEGLTADGDVEILLQLTTVTLSDLPRLGHIWNKNPRKALCFRNLRVLKVQNCENLRFLFSSSMANTLQQIREIEIASCKLLEEIIYVEEEESEEAASMDTIEFPQLTSLSLEELPNLRTFAYGMYRIHCPILTRLSISGCPKMMTFSSFEGKPQSVTVDTGLQQAFGGVNSSLSLPILFDKKVLFPSLEELTLVSCGLMKIWPNELSEKSFCKLASITVRDCENLSHIFPSTLIEMFRSLKMIEVVECTSLEALMEHVPVNSKKREKRLVMLELKEVKLWDLPRLNALVPSSTKATLGLPSLTNVSLRSCHSLRYLFTNDTSRTLYKLENLDVSGCNDMQEVIATEESEERKLKPVKFSHLSTLELCSLKNLISFSSGSCAYEFPSLRKLSILECTEVKAFILRMPAPSVETMNGGSVGFDESPHSLFDEKVVFPKLEQLHLAGIQSRGLWENEIPDESICQLKVLEVKQCPNLWNVIPSFMQKRLLHCMESLTVEECPRLRNLFTMSMAKSLVQLQFLVLGGCGEMEYIIAREEEKSEEAIAIIEIPQLVILHLHNMIKLRSFCQGKHISKWPSLKKFTIEDCKVVEVIVGDASCRRLEGSVPTQQPFLLVEKVEFPNMKSMKISHMDNVEKIWLGELASNAFTKLETLLVEYCEKLSSIFSSHTILTRFQNLEKMTVINCVSLEVVFDVQEFDFSEEISTSTFELRELVLARLPKMKCLWGGLPQGVLIFGCLERMAVVECESLKSLLPSTVAKSMTRLKKLLVKDCGMEEIIMEEDGAKKSEGDLFFPQLTDLTLDGLPELRSFYRDSQTSTWPLLKELRVRHCDKMRQFSFGMTMSENQPAIFPFEKVIPHLERLRLAREDVAMIQQHCIFGNLRDLTLGCYHDENDGFPSDFLLHRFPNLETLYVGCSSFEDIFPEDASRHGGASLKALGNLKLLRLNDLGNLSRVWKDGSLMAEILKQIEDLYIWRCPSLSIVLPSPTSFQSLTKLEVNDCASLVHMATCSAVTSLVHLTGLILRDCGAMKDVVTDDGNGVEEISFPELDLLILDRLPSLESFSPMTQAFMFPSLTRVIVRQCPKMNIFCKGALRTPNLHKVRLSEGDYQGCWERDLNTTVQTLSR